MSYQPKTGAKCHCKRGQQRDNCPDCEGTGMRINFAAIRQATTASRLERALDMMPKTLKVKPEKTFKSYTP